MLIMVLVISILIVMGIYSYYKESNAVAFSMNRDETYNASETSKSELKVATGYFSLAKSEKLNVDIEASIDDGKMHIYILNENDKLCYQLDGQDIADLQKLFLEKGSYMVQVVVDGYKEDVVSLNYDINIHN